MSGTFVELFIIVGLVLLNGVFVAAEIALITVRRSRVEQLVEEGRGGAARVRRLIDEPGQFLAVIQLAITFIGFLASAFAALSLVGALSGLLTGIGLDPGYAAGLALVLVTVLLSLFTIVFGELVPKTLALAHPERFALTLSGPVAVLGRLFRPIVAALTAVTRTISRALGADVPSEAQITAEELKLIIERGGEQGVLEAEEEQMINAVIELGERRVHEVIVPRIAIAALPATASFEEATDLIIAAGHSRIPVYEESIDHIVGILYAKDLLPFLKSEAVARPTLRSLLRPPVLVPESLPIDDVLHQLQRQRVHMAIVLDEYGGTAGLVTIEDLLEEIVGEIQDEYDIEEPLVVRLSDDEARVDGRAAVDQLAELFGVELRLEDETEYDTVGGLVFHRIGGVPSPGDRIEVDGLTLTVETTHGRRVGRVLVVRRQPEEPMPMADEGEG
jgi:putative hemolysin